jgi:hypothetical protein
VLTTDSNQHAVDCKCNDGGKLVCLVICHAVDIMSIKGCFLAIYTDKYIYTDKCKEWI